MDSSPKHSNSKSSKTINNLLDYNDASLQKILQFGRELFQLNTQYIVENGENPANTKMLRVSGVNFFFLQFYFCLEKWKTSFFFDFFLLNKL